MANLPSRQHALEPAIAQRRIGHEGRQAGDARARDCRCEQHIDVARGQRGRRRRDRHHARRTVVGRGAIAAVQGQLPAYGRDRGQHAVVLQQLVGVRGPAAAVEIARSS
jgi:hypothetical protein